APSTPGWTPAGPGVAPNWTPAGAGMSAETATASTGTAESPAAGPTDRPIEHTAVLPDDSPVENTAVLPSEAPVPDEPVEGYPTAPVTPVWADPAGPGVAWQPPPAARQQATAPLIPPLNDTRRSMQAWLAEAGEAHRRRVLRRRPIKLAVLLALLVGWGLVALFDAAFRVPF